ncbi:MAG TPA: phospholipase D family protein [Thermoanaerobaculia bacterium]|nr:phospholipase D family protein [Thermoanaerobaculia bacterium]
MSHRVRVRLALWLLLLVPLSAAADEVRLLETDREAAEARAEMVLDARSEVLASYFILGHDPFTLTALSLLRDAARQGLRVQVLVDAQWNKVPPAVQAHLLEEGIEIRAYHPFRLSRPQWVTRRMHDKLVIVDGEVLLAGGRNIESPYFGLGPKQLGRRNYLDLDAQVRGDTAGRARAYFLEMWESAEVHPVEIRRPAAEVAEAARLLDGYKEWLDARILAARSDAGRVVEDPVPVNEVRFLHDPVGRKGDHGVGHELLALMDAARESVIIESPYLVPSRAFRQGLRRTIGRGVKVRILTNSLATTDNLLPQAAYARHKKWLVRTGVELWEYSGPESLHTKAAVLDGERLIVGSFNLDPRSERLNTEIALVFASPPLAEVLRREMDDHLTRAHRIDEQGRPEGTEEPYPGVSRGKVIKLHLLRLLAPFLEKQL